MSPFTLRAKWLGLIRKSIVSASQLLRRPGAHDAALSGLLWWANNKRGTQTWLTPGAFMCRHCCAFRINFTKGISNRQQCVPFHIVRNKRASILLFVGVKIRSKVGFSSGFLRSPRTGAWSSERHSTARWKAGLTLVLNFTVHMFHRPFFWVCREPGAVVLDLFSLMYPLSLSFLLWVPPTSRAGTYFKHYQLNFHLVVLSSVLYSK